MRSSRSNGFTQRDGVVVVRRSFFFICSTYTWALVFLGICLATRHLGLSCSSQQAAFGAGTPFGILQATETALCHSRILIQGPGRPQMCSALDMLPYGRTRRERPGTGLVDMRLSPEAQMPGNKQPVTVGSDRSNAPSSNRRRPSRSP